MEAVDFTTIRLARWRTRECIDEANDVRRTLVERLLDDAFWFRAFAERWMELGGGAPDDHATRLRRTAHAALYAAWEAEECARRYFDEPRPPVHPMQYAGTRGRA